MTRTGRLALGLCLGLTVAAIAASAGQAAGRPDDRAGMLGADPQQAAGGVQAIRPDDRAGPLGIGAQPATADSSDVISRYLVNHPAAVRPDDRAGPLGVGTQLPAADRSDVISRYLGNHPSAVRPDDRAGPLGVGLTDTGTDVTPAPAPGGSGWSTVGKAETAFLGALALALAAFLLIRHRRTAAGAPQRYRLQS
jgi:hypothetical protein